MSLKPNLEEQDLLAATFQREQSTMPMRDRLIETLIASGFAIAVALVWRIDPPHAFALLPAGLCLAILVLATRVRFDTPFGFTVATQLAFVPLLFALPVAIVPIATVAALAIATAPEVLMRKTRPHRLMMVVGNAWFAIGPVAVFALADTAPSHAGPLLLAAALGAQFAVDFTASALRFWFERAATLGAQLRDTWVYGIDAALTGIALVVAEDIHKTPLVILTPLPLLALLAVFARERHHRIAGLIELNDAYRGTALVLGDVVEADDGYTGMHCKGVVRLALALGEQLDLNAEQRRNLEFGALLHDVGKIAIPKQIINKPGKLDPAEWSIIETHTLEGQKMLNQIGGFMRSVGVVVRSHHERWDGNGYPDRLAGEAIPLEARIIACCDSWNAMRTDRSYRKALSHQVALRELQDNSGHQFDPRIVAAFRTIVEGTEDSRTSLLAAPAAPPAPGLGRHEHSGLTSGQTQTAA